MIFKFRVAAIAAAVLTFAGATFVGTPALALQGAIALPSVSYISHASAALGRATLGLDGQVATTLGVDARAAAAPDVLSLDALVESEAAAEVRDAEQECLANAVYFEARGEPLQGQLAVAEVVINRAASGRYPSTLCGVVVQPAQFSFVRRGRMPQADRNSAAWRRAVGVARVAAARMAPRLLPPSCLWYHANYVSPSWGRRLERSATIGLHIFYS
jgi:spore germination cell wall hydrolase CwlJ-like protein